MLSPGAGRGETLHLADANQQRPAVIFEKTYYRLYERVSAKLAIQPQEAPEIKIIDATTIDLCAAVFPWAKFRTRKGAIKLHTVLTGLLVAAVKLGAPAPECLFIGDQEAKDGACARRAGMPYLILPYRHKDRQLRGLAAWLKDAEQS